MKQRLDQLLVARGLSESREKAQRLIMAGDVFVDGRRVDKPGTSVGETAQVEVRAGLPYVSRGGYKLAAALDQFEIDIGGRVCADVGASTGGFTDVLLQRGAERVYAIDVGYGQLDWKLRGDPRVIVMERTNIRRVESLPEPIDFASIDVSFISLRLVLPVVKGLLRREVRPGESTFYPAYVLPAVVALVKPQFEAGRDQVGKGGVVRAAGVHRAVLTGLLKYCAKRGWAARGLMASPIKGPAGNVEFLLYVQPGVDAELSVDVAGQSWVDAALAEAGKLT